jgi:type I restriction enzyme, S subunit
MTQTKFQKIKISELGQIITGTTPPTKIKEYFGSDFPFIKPTDIEIGSRFVQKTGMSLSQKGCDKVKNNLLPPLSTCVVTIGSIGKKMCLTKNPSFTNQQINSIVPNMEKYDPLFVYYLLKNNLHLVEQIDSGSASGRQNVKKSSFTSIELKVPDLPTQQNIGHVLSKFDDLIENNFKRIELLEELTKLIFVEWFQNYRFPGYDTIKSVSGNTEKTPNGWIQTRLGDIATITKGSSYGSENLVVNGSVAFVTLKCILRGGGFKHSGIKRFEGKFKEIHKIIPGDVIVAVTDMTQERNIVARAARIPDLGEKNMIISMDLVKVTPINEFDKNWLYSLLRYSSFGVEVKEFANGVNVLHLKSGPIEDFQFIKPDESLIKKFANIASSMYLEVDNLHLKNHTLIKIRDALTMELLSGEMNLDYLGIKND